MHIIQVDRKKKKIPSQWNELTPTAFKAIVKILQLRKDKNTERVLCLRYLLDINARTFGQITPVQMCQMLKTTDFLFKDNRLTKNLLPVIKTGFLIGERYYGPADDFNNLRFSEFITADTYFTNFQRVQDPKAKAVFLNRFIAALYREKETDLAKQMKGDVRVAFNSFDIDTRSKDLSTISEVDKYCILYWYIGCRRHCEELYPWFFSKDNQKKAQKGDWRNVLIALPNEKLGTIEEIEEQYVHTIFFLMNDTIKNSKEKE